MNLVANLFRLLTIVILIVLVNSLRDRNNKPYKVVCYWGSWSFYRPGKGMFQAEDINPNLCTHIMYGFAILGENNKIIDHEDGLDLGDTDWKSGQTWGRGGWNEGSDKYSHMVSNPSSRKTFVTSVMDFLNKYDFDGLDLDWEYPAMKAVADADRKPGVVADKQNYIELLKELKEAFKPKGYLLSAAVSAGKPTIDRAYNVPEMNKYLDFINLMTYDFHGGWENKTAHNSPLYPRKKDNELDKEFTIEYAVNYWIKLGADPKKIILGLAMYGRTFVLEGADSGIGALASGAGGNPGPYTSLVGYLGYNEICEYLSKGGWTVHRDPEQKIPYAVKGKEWIGFDDVQSIKDKIDFLKKKSLGGGMVWSIDTDDFKGVCGKKYPLIKTISGELNSVTGPDIVIPETHVTGTTVHNQITTHKVTANPKSTEKPNTGGEFRCTAQGFHKDPKDNTIFHECVDEGRGRLKDVIFHCGVGTVYDDVNKVCKIKF